MFSRFDTVPACDGQTGQTDVQPISITCFSIADARNDLISNTTAFVVLLIIRCLLASYIIVVLNCLCVLFSLYLVIRLLYLC